METYTALKKAGFSNRRAKNEANGKQEINHIYETKLRFIGLDRRSFREN
jgi:hypothetical protein